MFILWPISRSIDFLGNEIVGANFLLFIGKGASIDRWMGRREKTEREGNWMSNSGNSCCNCNCTYHHHQVILGIVVVITNSSGKP